MFLNLPNYQQQPNFYTIECDEVSSLNQIKNKYSYRDKCDFHASNHFNEIFIKNIFNNKNAIDYVNMTHVCLLYGEYNTFYAWVILLRYIRFRLKCHIHKY